MKRGCQRIFVAAVLVITQTSCYTMTQGYYQVGLLMKREPISEVVAQKKETPERLKKLQAVETILKYAHDSLGLKTGKSYTQYVALDGEYVTYVVQAAEKRSLTQKTWWFPIVGSQPYLGYFRKRDAENFQKKLIAEGYDTTRGGVEAFSLLGYMPDPIYSSMLDNNDLMELAELLFHETTHLTLYIPNYSSFNENLADFVAHKAVIRFFSENPSFAQDVSAYEDHLKKTATAQVRFREFLNVTRDELGRFYAQAEKEKELKDQNEFLKKRAEKFVEIAKKYKEFMGGIEKGTRYENAFRQGQINNAVILGYSLYEAKQKPFEQAFAAAGGDVRQFLKNIALCLDDVPQTEEILWTKTQNCVQTKED